MWQLLIFLCLVLIWWPSSSSTSSFNKGIDIGSTLFPVVVFENGTDASHLAKSERQCRVVEFFSNATVAPYKYAVVCEALTPAPNTTLKLGGSSSVPSHINSTNLVETYQDWSLTMLAGMWDRLEVRTSRADQLPAKMNKTRHEVPSTRTMSLISEPTAEGAPRCPDQILDPEILQYYKSRADRFYMSAVLNIFLITCLAATTCLLLRESTGRLWQRFHQGHKYDPVDNVEKQKWSVG